MTDQPAATRVAIIGGGVSGLAAAHRLTELARERSANIECVVLEATPSAGGSIVTRRRDGFLMEAGPDAFITQKPWALALCRRLGIAEQLIQTNEHCRRTFVVRRGRMHPIPEGFMMLAPTRMLPFVTSRLFSLPGKLRMGLDLLLPRGKQDGDESLASFVRRRLGNEALERAAQPLVSGIYTADPENLSLRATMPRFLDMERKYRSLIKAMRVAGKAEAKAKHGEGGARYSMFVTFGDGLDRFVKTITDQLPPHCLRFDTEVIAINPQTGSRPWRIEVADGDPVDADALILAAPAYALSRMTASLDAELSRAFGQFEYASSATINLAYERDQIAHALDGFGLVVPHVERRTIIAATFSHVKFAGRAPEGKALLRAFIGGALNADVYQRDDEALIRGAQSELTDLLGIRGEPLFTTIDRWPRSMPQYAVGHLEQVARINERLQRLGAVTVCGNAFGGVGIPDCVHSGETAAETVLNRMPQLVPSA